MVRNSAKLESIVGVLTALTGLLYVFRVFGPTESEVVTWGILAVILGGCVVLLGININIITNFIKIGFVFFLVLIQIPAIILWFLFNGRGISDGTPPSSFVAHWIFAIPHMVIVLLGIILIISLLKIKMQLNNMLLQLIVCRLTYLLLNIFHPFALSVRS